EFPNQDIKEEFSGWVGSQIRQRYIDKDLVVSDDHDVIHFNNSTDLTLSTSLNDLDFVTLNIDGQSMDVDAPPDIIDVDEDDDFIDDEDVLPHDLADSDNEDLANDDVAMSADVARGHCGDGGGDDRPPPSQIFTGCRGRGGRKPNRRGRKADKLGTHDYWLDAKNPARALQNDQNREKSKVFCRQGTRSLAVIRDMLMESSETRELRDLGANMSTGVPYTNDQIMAMVCRGKQQRHILGVGRVLARQGRGVISINEPRCTHTNADVDEVKEENKKLRKELNMLMTVVRSDDQMSQLLMQLQS
ncbi:hypothetical protein Tco_0904936, partial [Tanacetum coccineum]